ncbi:thioredoxin [Acidaminobacterium chupaoyuni]
MTLRHITQDEFDAVVSQPGKKVLVDFFATWCNPCKMLAPMLEEIADNLPENAEIVKLDIDENMDAAKRFRVMSIPTLILFENGEAVKRMVGVQPQDEIAKLF